MAGELRQSSSSSTTDFDEDMTADEDEAEDAESNVEDFRRWLDGQECSAGSSGNGASDILVEKEAAAGAGDRKHAFKDAGSCPRCFNPPSLCSLYACMLFLHGFSYIIYN